MGKKKYVKKLISENFETTQFNFTMVMKNRGNKADGCLWQMKGWHKKGDVT